MATVLWPTVMVHRVVAIETDAHVQAGPLDPCRPVQGTCDYAWLRDAWLWDPAYPMTTVRLYFQIFRESDGTNPACTPADVDARVQELNADFLPWGFQFVYDWRYVDDSEYRHNVILGVNYDAMKFKYAVAPSTQINVYVTDASHSFQTLPWQAGRILTWAGGIVMRIDHFTTGAWWRAFQHEVGHYFGLLHTFNGYDDPGFERTCDHPCLENPATGGDDRVGDFCSDTPPQYLTNFCGPLNGLDSCSGLAWDTTFVVDNLMSYSLCRAAVTPQQIGRMHCWVDDRLRTLRVNPEIVTPSVAFGQVPLSVSFTGGAPFPVTAWNWAFGDGDSSTEASPTHEYTERGWYSVILEVQDTLGQTVGTAVRGLVYAVAETLSVAQTVAEPALPVRVDIEIDNLVPLTRVDVPFQWSGALPLQFDSASTYGLRSDHLTAANGGLLLRHLDTAQHRGTYSLISSIAPVDTGSGAVLSLYFTSAPFWVPDSAEVEIADYDTWTPGLRTVPGSIVPVVQSGTVTLACCEGERGDVTADGTVTSTDIIYLVNHVFKSGLAPTPLWQAGDTTCDDAISAADIIYLVNFVFKGGPAAVCSG